MRPPSLNEIHDFLRGKGIDPRNVNLADYQIITAGNGPIIDIKIRPGVITEQQMQNALKRQGINRKDLENYKAVFDQNGKFEGFEKLTPIEKLQYEARDVVEQSQGTTTYEAEFRKLLKQKQDEALAKAKINKSELFKKGLTSTPKMFLGLIEPGNALLMPESWKNNKEMKDYFPEGSLITLFMSDSKEIILDLLKAPKNEQNKTPMLFHFLENIGKEEGLIESAFIKQLDLYQKVFSKSEFEELLNLKNKYGRNLFDIASSNNHLEIAAKLLDLNPELCLHNGAILEPAIEKTNPDNSWREMIFGVMPCFLL